MTKTKEWQVAEARHRFGDLLEAASTGSPQRIRHRNGQEFILMSRSNYNALKRDLRVVLTSFDFGAGEDEFDRALAELHSGPETDNQITDTVQGITRDAPGHKHRKRGSKTEAES